MGLVKANGTTAKENKLPSSGMSVGEDFGVVFWLSGCL